MGHRNKQNSLSIPVKQTLIRSLTMGILKSFIIYRQLAFSSDGFVKARFMERTLLRLWSIDTTDTLRGVKPCVYISQLKKVPPNIWFWVNAIDLKIKLTRKRSCRHWGRLLPLNMSDQELFFLFFLSSLAILFLILTPWKSLWFFVHLLPYSSLERKYHCSHISGYYKGG